MNLTPKQKKDAMSNPVGRPPKFTDPEKLEILVDDYFEWIKGESEEFTDPVTGDTKERWARRPEPPTVTGLALHLGFNSKKSLYNYLEKPEFLHPIKKGLTQIEKYHEIKASYGDKCTGNIFILKNFGWKDTQHQTHDFDNLDETRHEIIFTDASEKAT